MGNNVVGEKAVYVVMYHVLNRRSKEKCAAPSVAAGVVVVLVGVSLDHRKKVVVTSLNVEAGVG